MPRTIDPIYPSAAILAAYDKKLTALVERMANDVSRAVLAEYKRNPPAVMTLMAQDASPSRILQALMRKFTTKWLRRFDELAPQLADYFATQVKDRSDRALARDMRRAGFTVRFKMTAAMNDAYQAVRGENVSLIKSIAQQHLTQVETLVNQSVAAGRDLHVLANGLEKRLGITKRRAAFIARDQNNRATSAMVRARQLALGITEGVWQHSGGGREPRPEHVAFNGKRFDLAKGHDFENGEGVVWPGTAINCRCTWRPYLPELEGI